MGSGCTNSYKNKCLTPISSDCVTYVGDPIPELNICTGDTLTEVQAIILDELLNLLQTGDNLQITNLVSTCEIYTNEMQGKENKLNVILQALVNIICDLNTRLVSIEDEPVTVYDTKCLISPGTTTETIVQSLINKVCSIDSVITEITNQLNNSGDINTTIVNTSGNLIKSAISTCGDWGLVKKGSGANTSVEIFGLVPPYCPIPCMAPLNMFDSTGKGLPGTYMCNYFICNGNNSTPDLRGYIIGGAHNLPGIVANKALDAIVDDSTFVTNVGTKEGSYKYKIKQTDIPSHTHTFSVDPAQHSHKLPSMPYFPGLPGNSGVHVVTSHDLQTGNIWTYSEGPLYGTTDGNPTPNNAMSLRQPVYYMYYIMRFPEKVVFTSSSDQPPTIIIN